MSEAEEVAGLDRVLMRLAMTEDTSLEKARGASMAADDFMRACNSNRACFIFVHAVGGWRRRPMRRAECPRNAVQP